MGKKSLECSQQPRRSLFLGLSPVCREMGSKQTSFLLRSVIGSVVGTCLGILGTTINNRMRMKELRQIVKDASMASAGITLASSGTAAATLSPTSSSVDVEKSLSHFQELLEKQLKDLHRVSENVSLLNFQFN